MYLNLSRKYLNSEAFAYSGYVRLFLWVTLEETKKCHHIPEGKVLIFWVSPMWDVILGESKIMIFTPFKIKLGTWVTLTVISSYCYYHGLFQLCALPSSAACAGGEMQRVLASIQQLWELRYLGQGSVEISQLVLISAAAVFRDGSAITGLQPAPLLPHTCLGMPLAWRGTSWWNS